MCSAFQSVLPDGQVAVALINTNTSTAQRVTVSTSLTGNLSTESYSAGDQNAAEHTKIVDGTTTAGAIAGGITLPAESILVLKSHLPSKVTLGAAATVKAGTKVTLKGKLTLNGAAAPAGTTVKIYRRAVRQQRQLGHADRQDRGRRRLHRHRPPAGLRQLRLRRQLPGQRRLRARLVLVPGTRHRGQTGPEAGVLRRVGQAGAEGDGDRDPGRRTPTGRWSSTRSPRAAPRR